MIGECFSQVANFLCVFCNPQFGTFLSVREHHLLTNNNKKKKNHFSPCIQPLAENHYKISLCSSFCSSLFSSCSDVSWGDLLPEKPANSADLCKMLFETQVQTENREVMYAVDIVDNGVCFAGVPSRDVYCSGCIEGSQCNPSIPPPKSPPPHPRRPGPPPTAVLTVGIIIVGVLVIVGAVAACRYFVRTYRESNLNNGRRGRDFYPSSGEADNEALNS